jgi:Protein of unknown function (DUF1761)
MFHTVNVLSVALAGIAAFIIGNAYYMALGKIWVKAHEFKDMSHLTGNYKPMIIVFFANFWMAIALYGIISHMPRFTMQTGLICGFLIWLGFIFPILGVNYSFTGKKLMAFAIDVDCWLVSLLAQGAILGYMGR